MSYFHYGHSYWEIWLRFKAAAKYTDAQWNGKSLYSYKHVREEHYILSSDFPQKLRPCAAGVPWAKGAQGVVEGKKKEAGSLGVIRTSLGAEKLLRYLPNDHFMVTQLSVESQFLRSS